MRNAWEHIDSTSTMFDFKEYYQRVAEAMPDDARIVEIGLSNGRSIIYLAEALLNLDKKFRLIGVENCDYGGRKQISTIVANIGKAGLGEYIELIFEDSLVASCQFNGGYFNHVFIDSSHKYQETRSEIFLWSTKMIHGFDLAGHDYFSPENPEVRLAVDSIIPADKLITEETEHGAGIWRMTKDDDYLLKLI